MSTPDPLDVFPTSDVTVFQATDLTPQVLAEVSDERVRQVVKFGVQTRANGTGGPLAEVLADAAKNRTDARAAAGILAWRDILDEEVLEAFAETDEDRLRVELLQVAAVAVSWVEDLDRKVAASEAARAAREGAAVDSAIAAGRLPLRSPGSSS